jgi:putative cell wall-binding protein
MVATVAAVATIGTAFLSGTAAPAGAALAVTVTRLAGADRFETAGAISAATFHPGSRDMVVARGDDFADALVASMLAGFANGGGPILLTPRDHLAPAVSREVERLDTQRVYLIGDQEVISTQVEDELKAIVPDVQRIAGPDRFATAVAVADSAPDATTGAYLASGRSFADALAAGPAAYAFSEYMYLTEPDHLPDVTKQAIQHAGLQKVTILGGTTAVSASVENELRAIVPTVERIAGPDRFATATAIADQMAVALGHPVTQITLARGDTFPDAIAASPHGGEALAPTIFTASPTDLGATTRAWLQAHASTIATVHVLGDSEAVSDAVMTEVASILTAG